VSAAISYDLDFADLDAWHTRYQSRESELWLAVIAKAIKDATARKNPLPRQPKSGAAQVEALWGSKTFWYVFVRLL